MRSHVRRPGRAFAGSLAVSLVAAAPAGAGGKTICESMSKGATNKLEVCLAVQWLDTDEWAISQVHFTHQIIGGDGKPDGSRLLFYPIVTRNGGKTVPSVTRTLSSREAHVRFREKAYTYNCLKNYAGDLFDLKVDWSSACHNFGGNGSIQMRVKRFRADGTLIDDFNSSSINITRMIK